MKLKIVRNEDVYELRTADDEVIYKSERFKDVQKMYHDLQLKAATSKINQTLRGK